MSSSRTTAAVGDLYKPATLTLDVARSGHVLSSRAPAEQVDEMRREVGIRLDRNSMAPPWQPCRTRRASCRFHVDDKSRRHLTRCPRGKIAIATVRDLLEAADDPRHRRRRIPLSRRRQRFWCYRPRQVSSWLFWSLANQLTADQRRAAYQTIDYHYDVERLQLHVRQLLSARRRRGTGAHALIAGSSRRKRLGHLLGIARLSDTEAWRTYGREAERTLEGPAGFGFLEDASCYRQGSAARERRPADAAVALPMTVPALGFGTAAIMGRVSRRAGSCRTRTRACGGHPAFRHGALLSWLRGRGRGCRRCSARQASPRGHPHRHQMRHPAGAQLSLLSMAKSAARWALTLAPGLKAQVRRVASAEKLPAGRIPTRSTCWPAARRRAFAELGVSYVDDLLLHNFSPDRPGLEEVGVSSSGTFSEPARSGASVSRWRAIFWKASSSSAARDLLADRRGAGAGQRHPARRCRHSGAACRFIAHSPFTFMRQQAESGSALNTLAKLLPRPRRSLPM